MAMIRFGQLATLAAILGVAVMVAGCNTIEGAGKDIKAAGGGIEKAAAKSKPY
jgi:predicted small secreted protein